MTISLYQLSLLLYMSEGYKLFLHLFTREHKKLNMCFMTHVHISTHTFIHMYHMDTYLPSPYTPSVFSLAICRLPNIGKESNKT